MTEGKAEVRRSLRGLDWINFFTADVPTRTGPFSAIYSQRRGTGIRDWSVLSSVPRPWRRC
jgi:hypothetical protein